MSDGNGIQTRTVYVCDEETNFLCQDRTEEQTCVAEPEPEPEIVTKEFSIEFSDNFFRPSSIEASEGDLVKITFKSVPPHAFGGGDVRDKDGLVKTGKIQKGNEKTIEFTMPGNEVKLTNYWPATSRRKADMIVKLKI